MKRLDKLDEECEVCPDMKKIKPSDSTGRYNACKICPVGKKIGEIGEELIELLRIERRMNNKD